jgi:hypothetical protein
MNFPDKYKSVFQLDGLFSVKSLIDTQTVNLLRGLTDQLMLGERSLEGMFFQLDPNSPEYSAVNFDVTTFSGPSLNYRKIKDLEYIPEFLRAIQNSEVKEISRELIGENVSSMRMMVVNKPSKSQTPLPWHQDISRKWPMSKPPVLTIWIALDEVDQENGCVEWIKGSHKLGEIDGGHLTSDSALSSILENHQIHYGTLEPGDAVVFDNGVIHRSQPNHSGRRRRGLTICLMHGDTMNTKYKTGYPIIFGTEALSPDKVSELTRVPEFRAADYGE